MVKRNQVGRSKLPCHLHCGGNPPR
jgi:hypothetical protein